MADTNENTIEQSFEKLEEIITKMESSDVSLDCRKKLYNFILKLSF